MKYKHIPSMLHNFGHSFMSLMNYVDDEYVVDLLPGILRATPDHTMSIHFPDQRISPDVEAGTTLRKSVGYWADALPPHMAKHGIPPEALPELDLVLSLDNGLRCHVRATDDRGKHYDVRVQ